MSGPPVNPGGAWAEYVALRRRFYWAVAALAGGFLFFALCGGAGEAAAVPFVAAMSWYASVWWRVRVWRCPACGSWFNSFGRAWPGDRCVRCGAEVGSVIPPAAADRGRRARFWGP